MLNILKLTIGLLFIYPSLVLSNELNYSLHIPAKLSKNPALVVVIHGCLQSPSLIAASSHWDTYSDKHGFLVLYPSQTPGANPYNCWNWFDKKNQKRDSGEPQQIVKLVQKIIKKHNVDTSKVFAVGMSSGGGMVNILGACYPEMWQGLGVHSGPAYASADTPLEIGPVLKQGPKKNRSLKCSTQSFSGKLAVVHGVQDEVVHFSHGEVTVQDFSNASVVEEHIIKELGHKWSGGMIHVPFSDPKTMNATEAMVKLFGL